MDTMALNEMLVSLGASALPPLVATMEDTQSSTSDRTFERGRGGLGMNPSKTCMLCIEFQNEFTTQGGKLHAKVKPNMDSTGMLSKTARVVKTVRSQGVKIFHAPISFAPGKKYSSMFGGGNLHFFLRPLVT